MEKIYVSYSIASAAYGNGPVLGYHKVLNYIDNSGRHFIIEGEPSVKFTSTLDKAAALHQSLNISEVSPFGRLVTQGELKALNRPGIAGG